MVGSPGRVGAITFLPFPVTKPEVRASGKAGELLSWRSKRGELSRVSFSFLFFLFFGVGDEDGDSLPSAETSELSSRPRFFDDDDRATEPFERSGSAFLLALDLLVDVFSVVFNLPFLSRAAFDLNLEALVKSSRRSASSESSFANASASASIFLLSLAVIFFSFFSFPAPYPRITSSSVWVFFCLPPIEDALS
jgi:hypothetical protein